MRGPQRTPAPDASRQTLDAASVTLGILAGGRATRLGGLSKAWLRRDGVPQVVRIARAHRAGVHAVLVSANDDPVRYAAEGLVAVPDRAVSLGPIGGLQALALACTTRWLLTLPVDALDPAPALAAHLVGLAWSGAWLEDDDGPQPLAALWRATGLREATAAAIAEGAHAVHALHGRMGHVAVRVPGLRLGNLNTFADLDDVGMEAGA